MPEHVFRMRRKLPASDLYRVTPEHIWHAIEVLRDKPAGTRFGPSTSFDLITSAGRLPPKAVFGLAASKVLAREVLPEHFAGGRGTVCFRILRSFGYKIVRKGAKAPSYEDVPLSNEDREWAEGAPRLVSHLKRERAPGLALAKKTSFRRKHGRLFCERCKLDPVVSYGSPQAEACIEVHHKRVHVKNMDRTHKTRLRDLQCLCANCHRIVHRLMKRKSRGHRSAVG